MASKAAQRRLSKEYLAMQREPPPFIWATPDEKNILIWNYLIRGPLDSPYAGGEYHGVLTFPPEYPFKPPGIKMFTPSGRFQPDRKICFSMSDFHPGSWNPAWSVATILTGLLSFMLADEMTTGSVNTTEAHKRAFATRSHPWNLTQSRFRDAFPEYATLDLRDLPNMGEKERGVPDTPLPLHSTNPASSSSTHSPSNAPIHVTPATTPSPPQTSPPAPASPPRPTSSTNRVGPPPRPAGWLGWRHFIYEKWQLCAVIALAVVVSRFSTRA